MSLCAVIVVRGGVLPTGAQEAFAEADGVAILVGDQVASAAAELRGIGSVTAVEASVDDLGATARSVVDLVPNNAAGLVLPASPDGRDLAPRLAALLGWPLLAGAVRIRTDRATLVRTAGRLGEDVHFTGPVVATLIPGVRGVAPSSDHPAVMMRIVDDLRADEAVQVLEVLPPDPATMDLTEAPRIVAGGQGLASADRFALLGRIGTAIGASLGGTRVASDAGWIPFDRQIGTTGVAVNPRLYLAFAISGATQHTSGLGSPDHIISVNTDASCPMMAMADLAIVSDAGAVLDALAARLGLTG